MAAPLRDGTGRVVAALNVTVHAAETSLEVLLEDYLPTLLRTASAVSQDWARFSTLPQVVTSA